VNLLAAVVLAGTLAAVLVRQLRSRGPPLWTLFGAGALGMLLTGVESPWGALLAVEANGPVLGFLFALFVLVAALERAGALEHLAAWAVAKARRPEELPAVLFVSLGLLSAFLVNDALVLVAVPVLLSVARRRAIPPEPLLLTLAFSVSVGSALTPFGNPQDLLISLQSGLVAPIRTFLRYLLVPTLAGLVAGGWYLRRVLALGGPPGGGSGPPDPFPPSPPVPLLPRDGLGAKLRRAPVLLIFPVTIAAMIVSDLGAGALGVTPLPLDLIALAGAAATLLGTGGRVAMLRRVNWAILALFAGLFVVVAGALQGGVIGALERALPLPGPGDPAAAIPVILLSSLVGSQLVSNVPWVGLQIAGLHQLGYGASTPRAWMALAAGSTFAGNVTFLGAASNLIVVAEAERAGIRISLRRFVRLGLPIAAMTVAILAACLLAGI